MTNLWLKKLDLLPNPVLSESLEDYLETIYHITSEKKVARVKQISERLNVNKSSVSGALHILSGRGLINHAPYQVITLTAKGVIIAKDIISRHQTIRRFFIEVLAVDLKLADETACKMEHIMPREILEKFAKFIEFSEHCAGEGFEWAEGFGFRCNKQGKTDQ
ncbi:MAG: metal-dependent transcriptional regulator [candidate division Zixibacteria bacterium]|nr:metal-dependent transcriptional regulator [candidate division Zixibacteria bacterium]